MANKDYFQKWHDYVIENNLQGEKNGGIVTIHISDFELDGGTYLVRTYDPETGEIYDPRNKEGWQKVYELNKEAIESGELVPYETWQEAEEDRASWYDEVVGNPITAKNLGGPVTSPLYADRRYL